MGVVPAAAPAAPGTLAVELNGLAPADGACRLTFTVENGLGRDIDSLVYEAVLFDDAGAVRLLTLFDFLDAPQDRLRVRQFDLPGLACDEAGMLLFNGVAACEAGGEAVTGCAEATRLTTRTAVEVRQ